MVIVNDLKPGMSFIDGQDVYSVISVDHNKTAMRQMIIKIKVRNIDSGVIKVLNYTGGDKVETVVIDRVEMEFMYDDGLNYVFMSRPDYSRQVEIPKETLEWESKFLKPGVVVSVNMYGEKIVGVNLPDKVELQIVECEQAVKGDTATSAQKNAVLETGLEIKVPLFIQNEEVVIVSTADGKYSGRA